jgi:Fic family protein
MRRIVGNYIHQHTDWPNFHWDTEKLHLSLGVVHSMQGRLMGKMETLGFSLREDAVLENLTVEVLKSTEIEGEFLNSDQVRSSLARHLGMEISGLVPSDRNVDGVVEMVLDATLNYKKPLTTERLFGWHSALFPAGRSGMYKITTGDWRKDETGPMQVVSGAMGKERIHFQAPDAKKIPKEITVFLKWFNKDDQLDPVLKAGIAHLWFVTIHPFEDGNGRIARAVADMQLARADKAKQRFYSMSAQIRSERSKYYELLEKTQKGNLDCTEWLEWFINCLKGSVNAADSILASVLAKANFWKTHSYTPLNERQRKMVNKLLENFEGKLTSSKWAKMMKCSADTALRDIQDLITKQVLKKEAAGGRSTNYELNTKPALPKSSQ